MRRYHPLEFVTALLINNETIQDLNDAEQLAKLKGITIELPKYGKSRGDYFCDKETNSIYKGVGSIKGIGSQIGEDLYNLSQENNFESFKELLIYCVENQVVGMASLRTLTKIGYFSMFEDENYLLTCIDLVEKRYKRTHKDTTKEKRIVEIMDAEIVSEKCVIQDRIKWQVEYFGGTNIVLPDSHEDVYVVLDISKQWTNRDVKIYQLKTGDIRIVKISFPTLRDCDVEIGSTIGVSGFYEEPKLMPDRTDPSGKKWIPLGHWEDEEGNKREKLTIDKQKTGRFKKVGSFNTKVTKIVKL